jgi:hypothetical protein
MSFGEQTYKAVVDLVDGITGTADSTTTVSLLEIDIANYKGRNWGDATHRAILTMIIFVCKLEGSGVIMDGIARQVTVTRNGAGTPAVAHNADLSGGVAATVTFDGSGSLFRVRLAVTSGTKYSYLVRATGVIEDCAADGGPG